MEAIDRQMRCWSTRLRDDVGISPPKSNALASSIASEVSALSTESRERIKGASLVPLPTRLEELTAFQQWMDIVNSGKAHPAVVRAQVITQNYICFVYLGESCFTVLNKELPSDSAAKKCCTFLTNNPVRAFRNAMAHANWQYLPDFSGLEFWAKKGADPKEQTSRFVVLQNDLAFWQALARCVAYASYLTVCAGDR